MEALLEKYKHHPTVELIYFPIEVNRKEALLEGKLTTQMLMEKSSEC